MRDNEKCTTLATMVTRIKNEMEVQDVTQRELAKYLGVTEASMSRWLNLQRKMPFDIVSKCMTRFGLEIVVRERDIELPPVMSYCMERETWCEHTTPDHYCKFNVCYKQLKRSEHDE